MQKAMFEIKCSDCGQTALVPFKPTAGKPVYCRACFSKHSFKPEDRPNTNGFAPKQAWARRRDHEPAKKEAGRPGSFRWSFSGQEKTN